LFDLVELLSIYFIYLSFKLFDLAAQAVQVVLSVCLLDIQLLGSLLVSYEGPMQVGSALENRGH
jgi:hypothetical protein